jgi:hypothetical protein
VRGRWPSRIGPAICCSRECLPIRHSLIEPNAADLQPRIDRFAFQCQYSEHAFVDASQRLAADESLQGFDAEVQIREWPATAYDLVHDFAAASDALRQYSPGHR